MFTGGSRGRRRSPVLVAGAVLAVVAGLLAPSAAAAAQPAKPGSSGPVGSSGRGGPGGSGQGGSGDSAPVVKAVQDRLRSKGSADVWVVFAQRADLTRAARIRDWNARGAAVVRALRATAGRSQAAAKGTLRAAHADYTAFWAANRILVRKATPALTRKLAALPEVKRIAGTSSFKVPAPAKRPDRSRISTVEWNIGAIHADRVWSDFGDRGEGITVASIDSGVQYDHPALVNQYRGNLGNGTFDHNHNWYDPSDVCGAPSAPCDTAGHGTHVMGTMVGDDGHGNQIGVAPGAKWITAKGCESDSCSDFALLSSGQWMLAPTDLNGDDPRPDLRPNVVNNSWSNDNGPEIDPFYDEVLQAWTASGIFATFANGNGGPDCDTTGSPADSPYAYGVGSFNRAGHISGFSGRGPAGAEVRPNLAAPGARIRSSYPTNTYQLLDGTSMAAPHVAGTVALVLSAAPALLGDVAATEAVLNESATDVDDESCGGTSGNNNVWGEGKVDALAAVTAAPRGDAGVLSGTVTSAADGSPIAGATIRAEGPLSRTVTTGADGTYRVGLPVGTYTVTVHAFGYAGQTETVPVRGNATTTKDFVLAVTARHSLAGTVTDDRDRPVSGALVTVDGTPLPPATTDEQGHYTFDSVPADSYTVTVTPNGCLAGRSADVMLDADKVVDFGIASRTDTFGYRCSVEPAHYVEGDTDIGLTGDDVYTTIDLPFQAVFYGTTYQRANVTTNGFANFAGPNVDFANVAIPNTNPPNAAIYAFWDDLEIDDQSGVYTGLTGTAPNRSFVIEWRNARFYSDAGRRIDAEIVLRETGEVGLAWRGIDPAGQLERGLSATTGIENADGADALQYSSDQAVLSDAEAVWFVPPRIGFVTGTVTDANDGDPVANATVDVVQGSTVVEELTTGADGVYSARLAAGDYTVRVSADNYGTAEGDISIVAGETETRNFSLTTGRAGVTAPDLSWVLPDGVRRPAPLTISNTGSAPLTWQARADRAGEPWLSVSPGSGTLAPGESQDVTVTVDTTGLSPGVYRTTLVLDTNSGRQRFVRLPVQVVVAGYWKGVNAGDGAYTDTRGLPWVADQPYAPGGFGWIGASTVHRTSHRVDIAGTGDDPMYRNHRQGMTDYRFDGLPAGKYEVTLDFAELGRSPRPGTRMFDVAVDGDLVLFEYDIAARVGGRRADSHSFVVDLAQGGTLQVHFHARRSYRPPIVNALRVVQRPDL